MLISKKLHEHRPIFVTFLIVIYDYRVVLYLGKLRSYPLFSCQSYKGSAIVIYDSRGINISNLLVITTLRVIIYEPKLFIRLGTG